MSSRADLARHGRRYVFDLSPRGGPSAAIVILVLALVASPRDASAAATHARHLKVWPFFEYRADPAAQTQQLKILGPLFEYRTDADFLFLFLRPLLSIRQARAGHDDEVRVLYPLLTSRWRDDEQRTLGLGGVFSYRTTTAEDGRSLTSQNFRAFPFYFYRWDRPAETGRLSILPFYADLDDFLGFERVQMVAFPAYLRLRKPLVDRHYVLFPFFGTVGGALGSGVRVWPFYGRKTLGATYDSGFVAWPFYVWETNRVQDEVEEHTLVFPLWSRVRGPRRESMAYGVLLYTHSVERDTALETWGFPWPLWLYQRNDATGERTTLRLFPFYQDRHQGDLDARFVAWPLYRHRTFDDDAFTYERTDGLLVLYRDERRAHRASATRGRLRTLFPAFRAEAEDGWEEGAAPALFDAVLPRNPAIRDLYAPLWELYAWRGAEDAQRWSVAWGAVAAAPDDRAYPWHFALDE